MNSEFSEKGDSGGSTCRTDGPNMGSVAQRLQGERVPTQKLRQMEEQAPGR